MRGRYVETLTWREAERAIGELPTVLLPLGARTKEHGLHLPLDNDFRIAEYLAHRVAQRCSVLVLPTLPYGFYPAFTEYPGSVHVGFEAFRDMVVDICASYALHGSQRFYVLNTGVSTLRPLEAARVGLAERGIAMRYTDFEKACATGRERVETQPAGTHADEIETSIMLYIAPEVVRMDLAEPDVHPVRGPGGLSRDPSATSGIYSPTGSYGDPTRATRDKGQILVESLVAFLLGEIENFDSGPTCDKS